MSPTDVDLNRLRQRIALTKEAIRKDLPPRSASFTMSSTGSDSIRRLGSYSHSHHTVARRF